MKDKKNTRTDIDRNNDINTNNDGALREDLTGSVTHSGSAGTGGASNLDEKSSTMGRRHKGSGLATKDGVTGSDYDGQLSE